MSLSLDTRIRLDHEVVIAVRGEVDAVTVGELRRGVHLALTTHRPHHLLVDLAMVTFMDSMGIGTLISAQRAARELGCRLTVADPSPFIYRTLHMMGLLAFFGVPVRAED